MFGLFWLVVANAAALLGAHALLRRVATGAPHVDAVLFLLLRLAILSAAVLAAGMGGFLTAAGLGVAATLALAFLFARGAHRELRPSGLPDVGLFSGILAALVVARLLAQVWFFAPYNGDVLSYHLPKVAEWVRAGAFTREMGVDSHVTFPAGFELVEAWWVVFLHHDALIEMAGLEFLALGCASAYALARHLGLAAPGAFAAALIYSLTPVLQFQSTGCINDAPAASLILTTAVLIVAGAPLSLILMAVGVGSGIKPIYAYALPGLLLLFVLTRPLKVERPQNMARPLLAALGIAVGSYWYLRNLAWFGNPIYPVGSNVELHPHSIQYGPSVRSMWSTFSDLINVRIYDSAAGYGPITRGIAGWGLLAFAVGMPSLIVMLRAEPRMRRLAAGLLVSVASILIFVQHDPWNLRFVMFFAVLPAIATAWLAENSRPIRVLAAAAMLVQFAATTLPVELPPPVFRELAGQPWRSRGMGLVHGIEAPGDRIGYYVDNRNKAYLLYRADLSRRVVYLRASSVPELAYQMNREGLEYVYASCVTLDATRTLTDAERSGVLRNVEGSIFARPETPGRLTR